jgi:hypothetical protein
MPAARNVRDFLQGMQPSPAREQLARTLPDRLLRAEFPSPTAQVKDVVAMKRDIVADLAPYPALRILAGIILPLAFGRKETYSELDEESAATVEYLASILLERPSAEPTAEPRSEEDMNAAIQRSLDRVRGITIRTVMDGRRREEETQEPLERIAIAVSVHDAISRWPGYAHQARQLADQLAADQTVAEFLRGTLGFDISQALILEDAATKLLETQFNAHGKQVAESVNALLDELEANPDAVPEHLRVRDEEERARRSQWLLAQAFFAEPLAESLSITTEELATQAKVDRAVAQAFLTAFSCSFGDTRGTSLLTGRTLVRQRPFIAMGEGRYLMTAPGNLLWAIRPTVEAAIKPDNSVFDTYEKSRSAHVEQRAAQLLGEALRTTDLWTNLAYTLDGATYEADVLATIDDVAIVVEAKGGALTDNAKRGRKRELKRELAALLGKSSTQALRLSEELQAGRVPEFHDRASGARVHVDLLDVRRVEAVVVTLEALGHIASKTDELRRAGLLTGVDPPWTVSLYDFEAIAQCCAHAAELTLYISRRRSLDERLEFIDECDLWMLHLRETLDVTGVNGRVLLVNGRSDPLNRALMFDDRMPTMKLDKSAKRRLRESDRKRLPGFISIGEEAIVAAQRGRRPQVRVFN